jgi:hypothetical protein
MDGSRQAEAANLRFHETYDGAREGESLAVPVLVVLADELVLVHRGDRVSISFTPHAFRIIKSVAHVAVCLFTKAYGIADARLDETSARMLSQLDRETESFQAAVPTSFADEQAGDAIANLMNVLSVTRAYLRRMLERGEGSQELLYKYAEDVGPSLLRCTNDATKIELAALHAAALPLLSRLTAGERGELQVVVLGDHQARVRSLGMQYFGKLLGEPAGEERRVTYGEGISNVDDALRLVGTRRLDRVIAKAFFGDAKRLQRDILGDAVKAQLADLELAPLT